MKKEQMEILENMIDKLITDLKSDRDKDIQKLLKFKEITKKFCR